MMKGILRNATFAGAVAAGTVLLAGGAAQASTPDMVSAGNNGLLNGTQLLAPIQVPIDICGNAIAVAGVAGAGCDGGSSADLGDDDGWWSESAAVESDHGHHHGRHHDGGGLGDMVSAGNQGVLNGTQLQAPVQVPVDICGNAVGALVGFAGAGCDGGSSADIESAQLESDTLGDMASADNNGVLNGTQLQAPVQVPVDICGNAVGALVGIAGAGCDGGSSADLGDDDGWWSESAAVEHGDHHGRHHDGGDLGDMVSAGNQGVLNGTQVQLPVQVPVDFSGNGIAVLGVAGAGSTGGSSADLG